MFIAFPRQIEYVELFSFFLAPRGKQYEIRIYTYLVQIDDRLVSDRPDGEVDRSREVFLIVRQSRFVHDEARVYAHVLERQRYVALDRFRPLRDFFEEASHRLHSERPVIAFWCRHGRYLVRHREILRYTNYYTLYST